MKQLNKWSEPANFNDRLYAIVGHKFGPNPETRLDEIRSYKKEVFSGIAKPLEIQKSSVGLEIGCGIGLMTECLAEQSKYVYAIDINQANIELAKKISSSNNIHFQTIAPPPDFSFIKDSLDYVFAHAVFIHLNLYFMDVYFNLFAKLVKPGGRIYFDIANADIIDFRKNELFREYANRAADKFVNRDLDLNFNSQKVVEKLAQEYSFKLILKKDYPQGITDLYFQKKGHSQEDLTN